MRLRIQISIMDDRYGGHCALTEEIETYALNFSEAAEILQAFHTLAEKFKVKK